MGKARITLLGMVLAGFLGTAQNFDRAKLDRYFDALEQQDRFMGSVAVSKGGEIAIQFGPVKVLGRAQKTGKDHPK